MPLSITAASARSLARRLDEALALVRHEFEGLDRHRQYSRAFARLMKPDPLGRAPMLGTDGRDLFVPVLREAIGRVVGSGGQVLDLGGGDGRTFALLADQLPEGAVVSVVEPNPAALRDYAEFLAAEPHLVPGVLLEAAFDAIDKEPGLPADGGADLVLALHMLYFVRDPEAALLRMARFLAPGAVLCVVASAGMKGYTEQVLRAFIADGGEVGDNARRLRATAEREVLLSGGVREVFASEMPELAFDVDTRLQPSRLYGRTLGDLIALANVAELADVDGTAKFQAAARLLRSAPESVALRMEDDGPRKGMWSVAQPQYMAIIRRRPFGGGSGRGGRPCALRDHSPETFEPAGSEGPAGAPVEPVEVDDRQSRDLADLERQSGLPSAAAADNQYFSHLGLGGQDRVLAGASRCASIRTVMTNLLIDPELLQRALDVSGEETKTAAVTLALKEFVARREEAGDLELFGTLEWDESFDYKKERSRESQRLRLQED